MLDYYACRQSWGKPPYEEIQRNLRFKLYRTLDGEVHNPQTDWLTTPPPPPKKKKKKKKSSQQLKRAVYKFHLLFLADKKQQQKHVLHFIQGVGTGQINVLVVICLIIMLADRVGENHRMRKYKET